MQENQENTVVEKEETSSEQPKNQNVLLGAISYETDDAYDAFLEKMDVNQAVFVLVAASKYAQSRGAYSLNESELIATAIRKLKKKVKEEEQNQDNNDSTNWWRCIC